LKGADFVDPNDPQAIAEKELTVAAIMIEEAAKKLVDWLVPVWSARTSDLFIPCRRL
jgi:hypothetical protein